MMTQSWNGRFWKFWLVSSLAIGGAIASFGDWVLAHASKRSHPAECSVILPNVLINNLSIDQINVKAMPGADLFHKYSLASETQTFSLTIQKQQVLLALSEMDCPCPGDPDRCCIV